MIVAAKTSGNLRMLQGRLKAAGELLLVVAGILGITCAMN
jgi:hypothetical protein